MMPAMPMNRSIRAKSLPGVKRRGSARDGAEIGAGAARRQAAGEAGGPPRSPRYSSAGRESELCLEGGRIGQYRKAPAALSANDDERVERQPPLPDGSANMAPRHVLGDGDCFALAAASGAGLVGLPAAEFDLVEIISAHLRLPRPSVVCRCGSGLASNDNPGSYGATGHWECEGESEIGRMVNPAITFGRAHPSQPHVSAGSRMSAIGGRRTFMGS